MAFGIGCVALAGAWFFTSSKPHQQSITKNDDWWYWSGNVKADDGRVFGFHLAFFRSGADGKMKSDFSLSDVQNKTYQASEQFSTSTSLDSNMKNDIRFDTPGFHADSLSQDASSVHLQVAADQVGLDLVVRAEKPLVMHGENGSFLRGFSNALRGVYESYTRMKAEGKVRVDEKEFSVSGPVWFDHESGVGLLSVDAGVWDWFGLQFDNGDDLMIYRFRRGQDVAYEASLVGSAGEVRRFSGGDIEVSHRAWWTSLITSVNYPTAWHIAIPKESIDITVQPLFENQEARIGFGYWEGSVTASGTKRGAPIIGQGHLELTGYRFE